MREETREQKSYGFIRRGLKRIVRAAFIKHDYNIASMAVQELGGAIWYAKWVGDVTDEEYHHYIRIINLAGIRYMIP